MQNFGESKMEPNEMDVQTSPDSENVDDIQAALFIAHSDTRSRAVKKPCCGFESGGTLLCTPASDDDQCHAVRTPRAATVHLGAVAPRLTNESIDANRRRAQS